MLSIKSGYHHQVGRVPGKALLPQNFMGPPWPDNPQYPQVTFGSPSSRPQPQPQRRLTNAPSVGPTSPYPGQARGGGQKRSLGGAGAGLGQLVTDAFGQGGGNEVTGLGGGAAAGGFTLPPVQGPGGEPIQGPGITVNQLPDLGITGQALGQSATALETDRRSLDYANLLAGGRDTIADTKSKTIGGQAAGGGGGGGRGGGGGGGGQPPPPTPPLTPQGPKDPCDTYRRYVLWGKQSKVSASAQKAYDDNLRRCREANMQPLDPMLAGGMPGKHPSRENVKTNSSL